MLYLASSTASHDPVVGIRNEKFIINWVTTNDKRVFPIFGIIRSVSSPRYNGFCRTISGYKITSKRTIIGDTICVRSAYG